MLHAVYAVLLANWQLTAKSSYLSKRAADTRPFQADWQTLYYDIKQAVHLILKLPKRGQKLEHIYFYGNMGL